MGVPVPKVLSGAIDLLRQKSEEQKAKQVQKTPKDSEENEIQQNQTKKQ